MITIKFDTSKQQTLDKYSLFLRFSGYDFRDNLAKIKSFWNRSYIPKTYEWEVPFCCWQEILELYKGVDIRYLNNPPTAQKVTKDSILNGLDFNGYDLYNYQLDGVKYGLEHTNFLLLDEQRIRKIITSNFISKVQKRTRELKTLFNNMWN